MKQIKLALLLLAALLAGVCIGFSVNRAIIRARIRQFTETPVNMPEHITQRLVDRLELNAEQTEQVRSVLTAYQSRMEETRRKNRALFDGLTEELRVEIAQYLTPAQQEEHKNMLAELDQRIRDNRELIRAYPPPFMRKTNPTNSAN